MPSCWFIGLLLLSGVSELFPFSLAAHAAPREPAAQVSPAAAASPIPVKQDVRPVEGIKYPVVLDGIAILDLGTGKARMAKLSATDHLLLRITSSEGSGQVIDSSTIVEWSVGDFSETKFSGANAVSGGLGFAAGALLFPSPATPLLLLLSPLMGMTSASQFTPDWRIAVREIGLDGREQLVLIQAFAEKDALMLRSLLEKNSGLRAGQRKSDAELLAVRSQRLVALEQQLEAAKAPLMVTHAKKPWCSSLDLSGKRADAGEYRRLVESINGLRKALAREPYVDKSTASSLEQWERYLAEHPDLRQWAKANPRAAAIVQTCPQIAAG